MPSIQSARSLILATHGYERNAARLLRGTHVDKRIRRQRGADDVHHFGMHCTSSIQPPRRLTLSKTRARRQRLRSIRVKAESILMGMMPRLSQCHRLRPLAVTNQARYGIG